METSGEPLGYATVEKVTAIDTFLRQRGGNSPFVLVDPDQ